VFHKAVILKLLGVLTHGRDCRFTVRQAVLQRLANDRLDAVKPIRWQLLIRHESTQWYWTLGGFFPSCSQIFSQSESFVLLREASFVDADAEVC
jgi:hypothetical protein